MHSHLWNPQNTNILAAVTILCLVTVFQKSSLIKAVSLFTALGVIYFFREPSHTKPLNVGAVTAPSFGHVTNIEDRGDHQFVSIFLSVLDPHAQYASVHGTIRKIEYIPGTFHPAQLYEKTRDNERCITTFINDSNEIFRVTQIAGFIARRILCFHKENEVLRRGDTLGMIRFGSRVDIEIPKRYKLRVSLGDYVCGPSTIIASI